MKWAALAAIGMLLEGCSSPMDNIPASSKVRSVVALDNFPMISANVHENTHNITVYITPSCPTCMNLYYDLVMQGLINKKIFDNYSVSFIAVPRVNYDHKIIKDLFCVQTKDRFASLSKYASSAYQSMRNIGGIPYDLPSLSASTARAFGLSDEDLSRCQRNAEFDLAIRAAWERGWQHNPERDWPLIMIDNQSTKLKTADALAAAVKERQ